MAENYCGKDCTQCSYQADLACPGCKAGPGRTFGGDCQLAKCCQERGHNTCATCNQNNWCGKQRDVEGMAETRFQKLERERAKRERLEKQVPLLAKCLTLIVWLTIVSFIPVIMSNDLTKAFPVLYAIGQVINIFIALAITAVYFCMGKVNNHYQKTAIYMAVAVVGQFLMRWITGGETPTWTLLVNIPLAVVGLLCRHHQYTAHSEVLVPVDYDFSEKWMKLWKWYVRLIVAMVASLLLIVIFSILGVLVVIAAGIGAIVIYIVELVYVCRMMVRFRTYAKELAA